jgi:hypothetical protein
MAGDDLPQRGACIRGVQAPFPRISYDQAVEMLRAKGLPFEWGGDFGGPDDKGGKETKRVTQWMKDNGISAVGNRSPGTLTDPAWTRTPLRYAPCVQESPDLYDEAQYGNAPQPRAGAAPVSVSADGSRLRISWVRDAGRPRPCPVTPQIG